MEIVIASHNVHKIRELRDIFKAVSKQHDLLSLHDFPDYQVPRQEGLTFQENASLKAEHAARTLNKWALADDSGLVVPILGGVPGVFSKYYAGEDATDTENRRKILLNLEGKRELERTAYYECCLALATPTELKKVVSSKCEGSIVLEERGRNGFGYDAIFIKHDYEKTFAELDDAAKNRISHRRKAFEKMILFIDSMRDSSASPLPSKV